MEKKSVCTISKQKTLIHNTKYRFDVSFDMRPLPNGVSLGVSINHNGHSDFKFYYLTFNLLLVKVTFACTIGRFL